MKAYVLYWTGTGNIKGVYENYKEAIEERNRLNKLPRKKTFVESFIEVKYHNHYVVQTFDMKKEN